MSQHLIAHVFSAVLTLERCLSDLGEATKKRNDRALNERIEQQSKIVRRMRQVANRLQLDYASENQGAATRTISIFYALNQMVRPEVMKTYAEIHQIERLQSGTFEAAQESRSVLH